MGRNVKTGNTDFAGPSLMLLNPSVRNQVGEVSSSIDKDGGLVSEVLEESIVRRLHERDGLRFITFSQDEERLYEEFFRGLKTGRLCEYWFLMCYVAMRDRGIWSWNGVAEQRLCDELWMVCMPPMPAAIQ